MPKLTICAPPLRSISSTMSIGRFFSASAMAASVLPCHFGFVAAAGDLDALRRRRGRRALRDVGLASSGRSSGRRAGRRTPCCVPSRYCVGISVARSDVLLAMYGYWSAVTSMPLPARRLDQGDGIGRTCPTTPCPTALMCEMWTRQPASRPIVIASSMASSSAAAFVADVAGVHAAVLGRDLRQGDDLVRLGVGAGVVDQAGGQAPGAVLHRLVDQLLHLRAARRRSAGGWRCPSTASRMLLCGTWWMTLVPMPPSSSFLKNCADIDRAGAAVAGDDGGARPA